MRYRAIAALWLALALAATSACDLAPGAARPNP
jgi:hypothetical protein